MTNRRSTDAQINVHITKNTTQPFLHISIISKVKETSDKWNFAAFSKILTAPFLQFDGSFFLS